MSELDSCINMNVVASQERLAEALMLVLSGRARPRDATVGDF